ncbi:MAG: recombination protein O N-terminal domain-containing protein [Candidatus Pacebacteria bacterium]|nr:recombination protein O N-terminal domain-containing protein [Candidatus Paceibacterota bacterium]
MSHAIYQTDAVILKTKNMRESNKLIVLYTQKFGLIYCSLQSVRELKSKMRFHTNLYSLVTVDLVQGRDIWRVTGIHENTSSLSFTESHWFSILAKFSSLINRLCSGEEPHEEIWQNIEYLFDHYDQITENNTEFIEIIFTIRILSSLGYWEGNEPFLESIEYFNNVFFMFITKNKKKLIAKINQRLSDTQL